MASRSPSATVRSRSVAPKPSGGVSSRNRSASAQPTGRSPRSVGGAPSPRGMSPRSPPTFKEMKEAEARQRRKEVRAKLVALP